MLYITMAPQVGMRYTVEIPCLDPMDLELGEPRRPHHQGLAPAVGLGTCFLERQTIANGPVVATQIRQAL